MQTVQDKNAMVELQRQTVARKFSRGGVGAYLAAMFGLARAAANDWLDKRAASRGAALTLYVLFSLAPMLILLVALASLFFDEETVRSALLSQLGSLIGTQGGDALKAIVSGAKQEDDSIAASVISGVIVLVTATSAFAELKESLDELWNIPPSGKTGIRAFISERILSFGLLLVLALMLMISLSVNAGLAAFQGSLGDPTDPGKLLQYGFALLTMVIVTVVFAFIYKFLPGTRIAWSDVIVGALLTALLFMAGKVIIGLYLGHGNFSSAYGAAGSIVALITWIYYSAQIFFFGALFTHEYTVTLGSRRPRGAPGDER
jgi:membrane protein